MPTTYDTLTYAGNEMSLAGWGFRLSSCVGEKKSQAPDTWTGTVVTSLIASTPVIPFEGVVTIQSGRLSATGAANSFSGGVIKFVGTRVLNPLNANPSGQEVIYEFHGGRYFLDNTQYKQQYAGKTGTSYAGEIILFVNSPYGVGTTNITVGQQIANIINYAINIPGGGLFGQLGTIDASLNVLFPSLICKAMTCSMALDKCLELFPTVTESWDYTVSPPKVNFIAKANATPITLPLFDKTNHKSVGITRRDDLLARSVVITYRITSELNGNPIVDYAIDQWGPKMEAAYQGGGNAAAQTKSAQYQYTQAYDSWIAAHPNDLVGANTAGLSAMNAAIIAGNSDPNQGIGCDPNQGIRIPSDLIDLSGFKVTTATGFLDCEPVLSNYNPSLNTTTNPSETDIQTQSVRRQWWSEHRGGGVSELGNTKIRFQTEDDDAPNSLTCIVPAVLSSGDLTGITILNAGSGYAPGTILTLAGGTTIWSASTSGQENEGLATIQVQEIDIDGSVTGNVGGIISAVVANGGYYLTKPSSPNTPYISPYSPIQGSGSGASFALSFLTLSQLLSILPNRIVRGTHHSWMTVNGSPVLSVKVRIKAGMQYSEYDLPADIATPGDNPDEYTTGTEINYNNNKEHHCDLELTNGVTGTYSTASSTQAPETYIIGVSPTLGNGIARNLWLLLNQLQYEGSYVKVETSFTNGVTMANSLNLSGGNADWLTMAAQITAIREDYGTHNTSVQIGPSKHLSAQQMSSLLNMWRFRQPWYNPAVQSDDTQTTQGGDVNMPVTSGNANTTKGTENKSMFQTVTYNS